MKAIQYLVIILATTCLFFVSCDPMSDCKNCEAVTYDLNDGHEISRESAIEYCGTALDEKENAAPYVNGTEKVVWECN